MGVSQNPLTFEIARRFRKCLELPDTRAIGPGGVRTGRPRQAQAGQASREARLVGRPGRPGRQTRPARQAGRWARLADNMPELPDTCAMPRNYKNTVDRGF